MWRRGQGAVDNWLLRKDMECDVCKKERQRRCCVLKRENTELLSKMVAEPFANAPLVHPFRHPSFHATQLRALNFVQKSQPAFGMGGCI
eukprot:3526622-Karenia_brevis.AAC.1